MTMKDKREAALKEIKRLTSVIDQMKNSAPNNKNQFFMGNSYSHIPPESSNYQQKSSEPSKTNISSFDTSFIIKNMSTNNKISLEVNYLSMIKKDLEGLYRDFIPLIPWDKEKNQQFSFIKVERKLNDCIQKAQDFIDTLEDMG